MKCVILHSDIFPDAPPDELDVLLQVEAVKEALSKLGFEAASLAFSLDTGKIREGLKLLKPDFVFNLTESVAGSVRYTHLAPTLLDILRIPYTGCNSKALFTTTDKILTKDLCRVYGLSTPLWLTSSDGVAGFRRGVTLICKSVHEDGSVGLDDGCVRSFNSLAEVQDLLREKEIQFGGPWFAEEYIDGREFNISLCETAHPGGTHGGPVVEVFPPAEIVFDKYPSGKPRIVGYAAKWKTGSFEDTHTIRRYDFGSEDQVLLQELRELALKCWKLFELSGYARVDFRVDSDLKPWLLEINANPCLAPGAGFPEAAARAGLTYEELVLRLAENLVRPINQ